MSKASDRLAERLRVQPDEISTLRVLMVASFLLGASLVLYYTAANAIFLTHYGVKVLPYVYIVNGVLVIAFGVGQAVLRRHFRFRELALILNAVMALTVIAFWAGMRLVGDHLVVFVMMAWFRLLFIYTTLTLWELAARLFDIRQGKRLFALVGVGVMGASVVFGLFSGLLAASLGTVNLLLLSGGFLALYAASLSRILRTVNDKPRPPVLDRRDTPVTMVRDRYTRSIFGLKTFSVMTAYIIEYAFYQQASEHFPKEQALAGFLGLFMGGATLVMVVVSAIGTGWLISKRGVTGTLSVMPIAMAITAAVTTVFGYLGGIGLAFFALVSLTMFTNQVLEKAVYTPTLVVLFQPMPRERRLGVRLVVEGWLGSASLILSGALLLLVSSLHPSPVAFVVLLVVVSVVFVTLSRNASAQYVAALRRATERRFRGSRSADRSPGEPQMPVDTEPGTPLGAEADPVTPTARHRRNFERSDGIAFAELCTDPPALDEEQLVHRLREQVGRARFLLLAQRDLDGSPVMVDCLEAELARVRSWIFFVLCCWKGPTETPNRDLVLDAEFRIWSGVPDDRANAIELLDVSFPDWLKRPALALVDSDDPRQRLRKLGGDAPPARPSDEVLAQLAAEGFLSPWSRRVAEALLSHSSGSMPDLEGVPREGVPMEGSTAFPPDLETVAWLRDVEIFRRVPFDVLAELSGHLRSFDVSAGTQVLTRGDEGDEMYIVRSGEVAARLGDFEVRRVPVGSVFGEMAVLDPAPRSLDVVATVDTELLILDRSTLMDLMAARPEVAAELIAMLVRRLRDATTRA